MSLATDPDHELSRISSPQTAALDTVCPSLLVALIAMFGSLWLSVGMGLKACPLCFYQRTFVMGVVAVLSVGLLSAKRHRGVLNFLALPMALAGFGVALFHEYLEATGKLECPNGVMGFGTAPQQSLAMFALLLAVIAFGAMHGRSANESQFAAAAAGVVVGGLLAIASVVSAPPLPPIPTKAYTTPFDMCRPPFRPQ